MTATAPSTTPPSTDRPTSSTTTATASAPKPARPQACARPDGYAGADGDCDDSNPAIHPAAEDGPNRDWNCDGEIVSYTTPYTTTSPTTTPYSTIEGTEIVSYSVDCVGSTVTFGATTVGLTSAAVVFSEETGTTHVHYSDEHDLVSIEADPHGAFDVLEQQLQTGVSFGDEQRNQSTVFPCDFYGSGIMSYAIAVWDLGGTLADCVAFGDAPAALINGSPFGRVNEPAFDVSGCRTEPGYP